MPETLMIQGLRDPVAERLVSYAHQSAKSLEQAVKDLLAIALGVVPDAPRRKARNGLGKFRGALSKAAADKMLKVLDEAPYSKVDPEDL